jgi:hypothetical protein
MMQKARAGKRGSFLYVLQESSYAGKSTDANPAQPQELSAQINAIIKTQTMRITLKRSLFVDTQNPHMIPLALSVH